ncbi:MAG: type II toxin-antitoxin system VapB family antitoxin [Candidatus Dormibacteraceae bacterium]
MGLSIKDAETERLAAEVASLSGSTKTSAVRRALLEQKQRLVVRIAERDLRGHLQHLLETEIWPQVPAAILGNPITRAEREQILGYGPEGV